MVDDAEALNRAGERFAESGDWGRAAECFQQAKALDPTCSEFENNLGVALFNLGDLKGALRRLDVAVRLDPSDRAAVMNCVQMLEAAGEYSKAVQWHRVLTVQHSGREKAGQRAGERDPGEVKEPEKVEDITWEPVVEPRNRLEKAFATLVCDPDQLKARRRAELSSTNYVICFTPRSGSSWLTSLLTGTNVMGRPEEWFNDESLPEILKRIPAPSVEAYVDGIRRRTKSRNGVFGFEVSFFWMELVEQLQPLRSMFGPDLIHIYLRRDDFVAQAISLYKATESGFFHSVQEGVDQKRRKAEVVAYDADKIEQWALHILQQEYGFERYFERHELTPLRLTYENLVEAPYPSIARIAYTIGVELPEGFQLPDSEYKKVSNRSNGEWAERFRAERREFVGKWTALRGKMPAWGHG